MNIQNYSYILPQSVKIDLYFINILLVDSTNSIFELKIKSLLNDKFRLMEIIKLFNQINLH